MKALDKLIRSPHRTYSTWAKAIEAWVRRLQEETGGHLEIGTFWITEDKDSGSFVARVRSRSGLQDHDSDEWEACVSMRLMGHELVGSAEVFLYKGGSVLSEYGPVSKHPGYRGQHLRYDFQGEKWRGLGWSFSDGPGEWEWVEHPGDEYPRSKVILRNEPIMAGDPVSLTWSIDPRFSWALPGLRPNVHAHCWVSAVFIRRDRGPNNLAGDTGLPKRKDSMKRVSGSNPARPSELVVNLSDWPIAEDWIAGKYYAILRLLIFPPAGFSEYRVMSELSEPVAFEILERPST